MQTEPKEYEIGLYPRGPNSCQWKIWPKAGGTPVATGVERNWADAQKASQRAKERLVAKG